MPNAYRKTKGKVVVELNAPKGIWCEFCSKDCEHEHLITISATPENPALLTCVSCAHDLQECLQRALVDAMLIDKETV